MTDCAHEAHDGPTDEVVRRRVVGTSVVVEFCEDCDPLRNADVAPAFEEVEAGA